MMSKFRIFMERAHVTKTFSNASTRGLMIFTVQEEQQESIYPNISCSWTFYQVVPPEVSCLEVLVGGVDVCLSKSTLSFQPSNQRKI